MKAPCPGPYAKRPFPVDHGLTEAALAREFDDPTFDTRMDRVGEALPFRQYATWPRAEKPPTRGKRNFGTWQSDQRWRWRVVGATIPELRAPEVVGVSREHADLLLTSGYKRKAGDDAAFGFEVDWEKVGGGSDGTARTHGAGAEAGVVFFDADAHRVAEGDAHFSAFADGDRFLVRVEGMLPGREYAWRARAVYGEALSLIHI